VSVSSPRAARACDNDRILAYAYDHADDSAACNDLVTDLKAVLHFLEFLVSLLLGSDSDEVEESKHDDERKDKGKERTLTRCLLCA